MVERDRIDLAIHRQLARRLSVLRDVERSGGDDNWSHLKSHGHRFPTVAKCVKDKYLKNRDGNRYLYSITDAGRKYLADIDTAQLSKT